MKTLIAIILFLVVETILVSIIYLIFSFIAWDMNWVVNCDGFFRGIFVLLSMACILPSGGATVEVIEFMDEHF